MKKVFIYGLILFLLFSCGNDDVEVNERNREEEIGLAIVEALDEAELQSDETSEGEGVEPEYVNGYRSITWWDLLSEEEFDYYEEVNASFDADPNYVPENDPPEPQVNSSMDGQQVRIPGFLVGVDTDPDDFSKVNSFLFVPYQGACIHVPAPPANQTIFAEMDEAVQSDPYTGFWLYGTIHIETGSNEFASYYYTFTGDKLEFYF